MMFQTIKAILVATLLIFSVVGCSAQDAQRGASSQAAGSRVSAASSAVTASSIPENSTPASSASESSAPDSASSQNASDETVLPAPEGGSSSDVSADVVRNVLAAETVAANTAGTLTVHFGDEGAPFTMYLYDNSTAAAIADYVGTADWRLPIYNYDGYENWEVMQYYDLPSRYEIPSNTETVTVEKAGEVYYSEPNRIVLFYGDAAVSGEYSRVGYFEATEDFISAVRDNPVLEGWGNKIVLIKE